MQLVRFTNRNPFVVITERTNEYCNNLSNVRSGLFARHGDYFVSGICIYSILRTPHRTALIDQLTAQHAVIGNSSNFQSTQLQKSKSKKKSTVHLITIHANTKLGDVESWLKPDGWLFVTIMGANADTTAINGTKPFGAVRKVLAFQSTSFASIDIPSNSRCRAGRNRKRSCFQQPSHLPPNSFNCRKGRVEKKETGSHKSNN